MKITFQKNRKTGLPPILTQGDPPPRSTVEAPVQAQHASSEQPESLKTRSKPSPSPPADPPEKGLVPSPKQNDDSELARKSKLAATATPFHPQRAEYGARPQIPNHATKRNDVTPNFEDMVGAEGIDVAAEYEFDPTSYGTELTAEEEAFMIAAIAESHRP